jgi:hypothetical protein
MDREGKGDKHVNLLLCFSKNEFDRVVVLDGV